MPLLPGKQNIGRNITELENHGSIPRSHKQIVAIALNVARKSSKGSMHNRGSMIKSAMQRHVHPLINQPFHAETGRTVTQKILS